jgi:ABC-type branched-subunit amino acid transport system substrate-binding protein
MCSKSLTLSRFKSYLLLLAIFLPANGLAQDTPGYISIGLLLPDQDHPEITAAAELAINEANEAGAYDGRKFKLQVRTAEGFWGAGSKESVSLVYEDQVRAIIGSLDGRNGHLAEQVATKSHLTYIECYATEPTLSQAFVPWFMRVVPNDNQQSELIVKQILKEGGSRVAILSNGSYDCKYAVKSLTKSLAKEAGISPAVIPLNPENPELNTVTKKINGNDPDHLVIPFDAPINGEIMSILISSQPDLKIYGTLHFAMGAEKRKESWKQYEGIYLIGPLNSGQESAFPAGSHEAFIYDAVTLVIHAIREVGTEREAITKAISGTTYANGASGSIAFDDLGNRKDAARLYQIQDGVPQLIK